MPDKYLLYEVEHDSLRNHVDHGSLNDVVVRLDKQLCKMVSNELTDQIVVICSRTDNLNLNVLAL